jgi:phosphoribosyl 1,2-cyclic phosphodiesterase
VQLFVLGSGSLGNALLAQSGNSRVLVDCGVGPRVAHERMKELGEDLFPRGVDGIVVTHHHDDHASKLGPFARACKSGKKNEKSVVWLHDGVDVPRVRKKLAINRYDTQRAFRIGEFTVEAFTLPHDAPQVALRLTAHDRSVAIVTDLGYVPRGLDKFLGECDEVFLESNYCPEMLAVGPYPPSVQRRVSGPEGHLSNEDAASLVARLEGTRVARVHLCHVSQQNNTPERALEIALMRTKHIEIDVIPHGGFCKLEVVPHPRSSGAFVQLGLFA